jgi:ABC-type Mn2+/Zn2+ transport system permease subunit
LVLSAALVLALALLLRFLFWPLVLSSFDPGAARAMGLRVGVLELVLLGMVAVTAIMGVRVAGVILTTALIVAPAAAALRWTRYIRRAMLLAAGIGAVAGVAGLIVAYYVPVAPAAVMVIVLLAAFAITTVPIHDLRHFAAHSCSRRVSIRGRIWTARPVNVVSR